MRPDGPAAEPATLPVGLLVGSGLAPERLGDAARQAEELGFDEVWVSEDFFFNGGISAIALALAATERIPIGLGVVSALVRHPALLAMEIATLERAYPGRIRPGIGLGVPAWMDQMALMPDSPLSAIRECVAIVRALLDTEPSDLDGRSFVLRDAHLVHPPAGRVPLTLGVIGPRMLELSGSVADGSILSVAAGDAYVRFARERIEAGRAAAGRTDEHRVSLIVIYSVSEDADEARAAAREALGFYLAAGGVNALTEAAGISDELRGMLDGGAETVVREMPDAWVDELTVSGDPAGVVERLRGLAAAGADAVVLLPRPAERLDELVAMTTADVLPRLRSGG